MREERTVDFESKTRVASAEDGLVRDLLYATPEEREMEELSRTGNTSWNAAINYAPGALNPHPAVGRGSRFGSVGRFDVSGATNNPAWKNGGKFLSFRRSAPALHCLHCMNTRFVFTVLLAALAIPSGRAADFPKLYNSETDMSVKLMPAAEAAATAKLPPGFNISVFAAEPDVQNPIASAWDAKGRLWVAENYTYRSAR